MFRLLLRRFQRVRIFSMIFGKNSLFEIKWEEERKKGEWRKERGVRREREETFETDRYQFSLAERTPNVNTDSPSSRCSPFLISFPRGKGFLTVTWFLFFRGEFFFFRFILLLLLSSLFFFSLLSFYSFFPLIIFFLVVVVVVVSFPFL